MPQLLRGVGGGDARMRALSRPCQTMAVISSERTKSGISRTGAVTLTVLVA
ncbi:hypothetical protein [Burkholderia plantarii]|uniref:hypothetical protein n=1 Tax=Burkholderia plantarii TaxID=41899 RepID=UPI00130DEF5D|nr:hypothetical protein [Burkholderia plantarii]